MPFFHWIDPMSHMTHAEYLSFWSRMFATLLSGFWSRLICACLMFLSFWFGVRRRNFYAGAMMLLLATIVAYGAGVFHFLGMF